MKTQEATFTLKALGNITTKNVHSRRTHTKHVRSLLTIFTIIDSSTHPVLETTCVSKWPRLNFTSFFQVQPETTRLSNVSQLLTLLQIFANWLMQLVMAGGTL